MHRTIVGEGGAREVVFSDGLRRPLAYMFEGEPAARPWRVWPLEVGKGWSIDVDWRRPDGSVVNTRQQARVTAYEEVSVPAGTFWAFRIEHGGFVRTPTFNGRMVETFWYAPAARTDVKHVRRVGSTDFHARTGGLPSG